MRCACKTYRKTGEIFDDTSGKVLDSNLVQAARQEELANGIRKQQVYVKVPLQECYDQTGCKPIGTRWVDVNKGDDKNPRIISRLVAQEINFKKRLDLFAATPPLECKKMQFSQALTEGIGFKSGHIRYNERLAGKMAENLEPNTHDSHHPAQDTSQICGPGEFRLASESSSPTFCALLSSTASGGRFADFCKIRIVGKSSWTTAMCTTCCGVTFT